jgi:hypothetical protein
MPQTSDNEGISLSRHIKATGNEAKTSQWEFDFESGKPAKVQKNYKWEAVSKDEVPQMYHVNHIKRLHSAAQNQGFEGQLPKLRYYHHIKKVEPEEENNNNSVSVIAQPITASAKKSGSGVQLKITGKSMLHTHNTNFHSLRLLSSHCRLSQREETTPSHIKEETENMIVSRHTSHSSSPLHCSPFSPTLYSTFPPASFELLRFDAGQPTRVICACS